MTDLSSLAGKPAGPLAGLVVVECGRFVTAPYAARMLGDLGATVIKIEGPDGDPFRTFSGTIEPSSNFVAYNRNKLSVAVPLATPEGRAAARGVVERADVFIENSRPGSMDRMGLGYDEVSRANPGIIYCSITGMGPGGPYVDRPAYDMVGQALSGLASISLDPETHMPTGTNTSDSVTGMTAVIAVLAALRERTETGRGQRIDIDMLSSSVSFIGAEAQLLLDTGVAPGPLTRVANSLSFAVVCADGLMIGIHLSSVPKFWESLVRVVGKPELLDDPRFATRGDRSRNYRELDAILRAAFATRDRAEWLDALIAADVPAAPVHDLAAVFEDPQVQHLGILRTIEDPDNGDRRTVGSPFAFSGSPDLPMERAPRLGEHTAAVLEAAGLDPEGVAG